MRPIQIIRSRLGVSQAELADAIERQQSNVSNYERGQTIPPDVARALIAFARTRGLVLTFDHVYGAAEVPRIEARAA
jgi:putative transcriptional regulator